jgi:CheY-like chemotaxis protein
LINDVLDIAALDAGTITWNDQPYELAALIQRVVERLRSEAEAKGLTLETEMEEQLPLMKADPERIEQVLNNLITNGIKFTERGKVSISARALPGDGMIHDWAIPPEGCVLISVRDTGVGMTPDEMQQIFRRFSQGGHTLLNKPKGTGLGLVISREIVLYYGGEIGVESEPGVGSTFYVMLPLTKPSQKPIARAGVTSERAQDTASVAPQSLAPPKITAQAQERSDANPLILVADGEPAGRDLLRQELHRGGYRVVTLTSGSDVIEQVGQQHPALVVLDVELSGISGMEVLHILKSDPATALVPVIMLSVGDKREECQALGAEACLFKPVDSALLRETIAGLIASRGPAS